MDCLDDGRDFISGAGVGVLACNAATMSIVSCFGKQNTFVCVCVCVCVWCKYMCVGGGRCPFVDMWNPEEDVRHLAVPHSLPYFLEVVTLTEPRARLLASTLY